MTLLLRYFVLIQVFMVCSYVVRAQEQIETPVNAPIVFSQVEVKKTENEDDTYIISDESCLPSNDRERRPKYLKEEIEELDTKELKEMYPFFKKKGARFRNMGLIAFTGGTFFTIVGVSVISNAEILDLSAAFGGALLIGVGIGGGSIFTLIGLFTSISYGQKAKWAREELQRRNEPLTRFKIRPGYDSKNQAGYLSLKLTF